MTNLSWFERNPFLLDLAQMLVFGLVILGIDSIIVYFTEERPLTLICVAIVLYLIIVAAATRFQYHPITVMWERVKIYCSLGSTLFGRCLELITHAVRRRIFFFLVSCGVVASEDLGILLRLERDNSETCSGFLSVRCFSIMIQFWAGYLIGIVIGKILKAMNTMFRRSRNLNIHIQHEDQYV